METGASGLVVHLVFDSKEKELERLESNTLEDDRIKLIRKQRVAWSDCLGCASWAVRRKSEFMTWYKDDKHFNTKTSHYKKLKYFLLYIERDKICHIFNVFHVTLELNHP